MRCRHAATAACVTVLFGGLAAAQAIGLRFNATSSMPTGLWRVVRVSEALRAGSIVVACPPDNQAIRQAVARGYLGTGGCPDAREPLLKTIAAIGGDVVAVSAAGVMVNGKLITGTIPLGKDSAGRPLSSFALTNYRLGNGEIWLVANADPRSFDSRYFGPVLTSHVIGFAQPIWTLP